MLIHVKPLRHQNGALLAMSLILLIILTITAIAFTRVTKLELKGVINYADRLAGLAIAENNLLAAEATIEGLSTLPDFTQADTVPEGFYDTGETPDPFDSSTWTATGTNIAKTTDGAYYIEVMQTIDASSNINDQLSVNQGGYGEDTTLFTGRLNVFRTVVRSPNPSGNGFILIESFYDRML